MRKDKVFEIMLHRQLRMDDGRGLAQGVHDNSRTSAPIWILLDSRRTVKEYTKGSVITYSMTKLFFKPPGKSRALCLVAVASTNNLNIFLAIRVASMFNYDFQVNMQVRLPL